MNSCSRKSPQSDQAFTKLSWSCTAALKFLFASSDLWRAAEVVSYCRIGSKVSMSYLPVCAKNAPLRAINSEIISLVKNLRLVDSMKSSAWSNNNTQSSENSTKVLMPWEFMQLVRQIHALCFQHVHTEHANWAIRLSCIELTLMYKTFTLKYSGKSCNVHCTYTQCIINSGELL